MAIKKISEIYADNPITTTASGDIMHVVRTSEPLTSDQNKGITVGDLFGATSGIPVNVGIGTAADANYKLILRKDAANCIVQAEYGTTVQNYFSSTISSGVNGTRSNHSFKIVTNNTTKVEVGTSGTVTAAQIYSTTTAASPIDVACDSTGLLGADPSSRRLKTNIVDLDVSESDKLLLTRPVKYEIINGGPAISPGFIAEEIEELFPDIVNYALHVQDGDKLVPISRTDYEDVHLVERTIEKNKKIKVKLKKAKKADSENEPDEEVDVEVENIPFTFRQSGLVPHIVNVIKKQQTLIDELTARVNALEGT